MTDNETTIRKDNLLYKKWHRTGFMSIVEWFAGGKVSVDVGSFDPNSGKLNSSTKCYVKATDLSAYLDSIVSGNSLFKDDLFLVYGGSTKEGVTTSRVFKIESFISRDGGKRLKFKCGHFKGSLGDQGAIKPDMSSPISVDEIQMTMPEVSTLAKNLNLALNRYVTTSSKWLTLFGDRDND